MPKAKASTDNTIPTQRSKSAARKAAATNPVRPGVIPGTNEGKYGKRSGAAVVSPALANAAPPLSHAQPAAQSATRADGHDNLCVVRGATRSCWCWCSRCWDKAVSHCVCKHCNCPQATGQAVIALRAV